MANPIDALLDQLVDPAAQLVLEVGRPPRVVTGDTETDAGQSPMTQQDILALLRAVVPPEERGRLRLQTAVTREYALADGRVYEVDIRWDGPVLQVTFSRIADREFAAEEEPPPPAPEQVDVSLPVDGEPGPAIDALFQTMCRNGASDLHLSVGVSPMLRIDGRLERINTALPLTTESIERLVVDIMPEANREEFDRRHDTDFAYEVDGLARFRANVFVDRHGMGAVFRAIPSDILTAEQLNLSPEILRLCHLTKGLVVVTGPTGSGKSTTLCAMIDYINKTRVDHIITIEDPIEFVHENRKCLVNQREVGNHTDSFRDALRAALREDPDIILVGEMRDLETVAIAIETAETGHLVFGTLHTTTAASTVDRIIDQFPADRQEQIRIMLSESLRGVIAQTLCRKAGGGRVAALEVLLPNTAIANLIREGKTFQIPSMMQVGRAAGMVVLNDALVALVKRQEVEPEEAYAKAVDKEGILTLFKREGIDTSFTGT